MKHTPLSQPGASPELLTTYTPIALTPASLSGFGLRFCCLCLAVLGNLCSTTSSKTWLRYQKPLLPWLFTISTFPRLHPAASLDPARSITSSCSAILQLVQRFISRRIMVFCFSPSLTACNILFTFLTAAANWVEAWRGPVMVIPGRSQLGSTIRIIFPIYVTLLIVTVDFSYYLKYPVSFYFSVPWITLSQQTLSRCCSLCTAQELAQLFGAPRGTI